MRVIGGEFGGRTLASPGKGDPAAHLRPTSDRVRESLFSILAGGKFGDPITGARVLDVFAGTGALGIEALSRGSNWATFLDNGRAAQALIRKNIASLALQDRTEVLATDIRRAPPKASGPYSLVFLDPPYGKGLGADALESISGWIGPGALIVWEESSRQSAPEGFTEKDYRRYGDTHITFLTTRE